MNSGALPTVDVLMSTYNGEGHLPAQLDSILSQEGVSVRVTVRDDGSVDGTSSVLAEYERDPRVRVLLEANIGLPHAFYRLIDLAPADATYLAIADQDDVWRGDKLRRAV